MNKASGDTWDDTSLKKLALRVEPGLRSTQQFIKSDGEAADSDSHLFIPAADKRSSARLTLKKTGKTFQFSVPGAIWAIKHGAGKVPCTDGLYHRRSQYRCPYLRRGCASFGVGKIYLCVNPNHVNGTAADTEANSLLTQASASEAKAKDPAGASMDKGGCASDSDADDGTGDAPAAKRGRTES
jgi:hypothetical protein